MHDALSFYAHGVREALTTLYGAGMSQYITFPPEMELIIPFPQEVSVLQMEMVMNAIAPSHTAAGQENWRLDGAKRVVVWTAHSLKPAKHLVLPKVEPRDGGMAVEQMLPLKLAQ